MSYRVEFAGRARKAFLALPKKLRAQVGRRIDALAEEPRPKTSKALHGKLQGQYRLRVGPLRVLYRVDDDLQLVRIAAVGPRRRIHDDASRQDT